MSFRFSDSDLRQFVGIYLTVTILLGHFYQLSVKYLSKVLFVVIVLGFLDNLK